MIKVSGEIRAWSQSTRVDLRIARLASRLQNIPNKMKDTEVIEYIEEVRAAPPRSLTHGRRPLLTARTASQVVGRSYDFFYLRCDYSNDCNVGCGYCLFIRGSDHGLCM